MNDFDALLSAPLPDRPDDGFSVQVMKAIETEQQRQWAWLIGLLLVSAALAAVVIPWTALAVFLAQSVMPILALPGVYVAAAALGLTVVLDRQGERL